MAALVGVFRSWSSYQRSPVSNKKVVFVSDLYRFIHIIYDIYMYSIYSFIETSCKCGQGFHGFPVSITSFGIQQAQKMLGQLWHQNFQKQFATTANKNTWGLELPFKAPKFPLEFGISGALWIWKLLQFSRGLYFNPTLISWYFWWKISCTTWGW